MVDINQLDSDGLRMYTDAGVYIPKGQRPKMDIPPRAVYMQIEVKSRLYFLKIVRATERLTGFKCKVSEKSAECFNRQGERLIIKMTRNLHPTVYYSEVFSFIDLLLAQYEESLR